MLYFAYREVKEYANKPQMFVADLVCQQVIRYWKMAPIRTVSLPTVTKRILKLIKEHDNRSKSKNKDKCSMEALKHEEYKNKLVILFDIASPDAEKVIAQDRFLVKKDKNGELVRKDREDDLRFLEDQRGPRVGC